MILKNGKRCRYAAKYDGVCGHHQSRSRAGQITKIGKATGAILATGAALLKLIETVIDLGHKLGFWMPHGDNLRTRDPKREAYRNLYLSGIALKGAVSDYPQGKITDGELHLLIERSEAALADYIKIKTSN